MTVKKTVEIYSSLALKMFLCHLEEEMSTLFNKTMSRIVSIYSLNIINTTIYESPLN